MGLLDTLALPLGPVRQLNGWSVSEFGKLVQLESLFSVSPGPGIGMQASPTYCLVEPAPPPHY